MIVAEVFFRARDNVEASPKGVPATVESSSEYDVKLRCTGDRHFYEPEEESKPFIEFLHSWGGKWMWEDLRLDEDPSWIVECLRNKTLTCVTDGSYMKDKAAKICSAGWVMACKQTKRHISGTLVEYSDSVDSYRGECLGMLAIRLFLLAVEEYYGVITDGNKVCCDNKGALYTFAKKSKRVSSGAKNADIKRVIRTIEQRTQSSVVQHHVKGHQDEYIKRSKLSWEASWNCLCDKMAKKAINDYLRRVRNGAMEPLDNKSCWMIPLETARL